MGKQVSKQDYNTLIYTEIFNVKAKSWSPLRKQILKDFECKNHKILCCDTITMSKSTDKCVQL